MINDSDNTNLVKDSDKIAELKLKLKLAVRSAKKEARSKWLAANKQPIEVFYVKNMKVNDVQIVYNFTR
jgi:hypothetical protein